jgi:glutathione S-transferase
MTSPTYRIFGMELSPYSVKVRSYFRYKQIPHEWIVRSVDVMEEYNRYAKLPLIPLVVPPDGNAMQDSTPIIEAMEARVPDPALQPADPTLAFLSALIEEYGDEWGNKPMFHYRWFYEADAESAADRIARAMNPGLDAGALDAVKAAVKGRMVPRLKFVGSSAATKDQIEGSFHRQLAILESHLANRPYLFGGRPALADLGLYAQLYECFTDPTPGALILERGPRTREWIERMLDPKATGDFEPWERLEPTLLPLLRDEVGAVFFPWTLANARAIAAGASEMSCMLGVAPFVQEPQKYHAKSLAALRARYQRVADKSRLDPILERAGCLEPLRGS